MLITAFMPYIEFFIWGGIKKLTQWLDKGFPCCPRSEGQNKTKKITNQQYINLYAGPIYLMHFRYSSVIVQVYVAFMYGLLMPIMFPIVTVGIFNMYFMERMTLAYYYKQPPMFDEKLNRRALSLLKGAPIAMFLMSYWAFGNTQIFFNTSPEVGEHGQTPPDPIHEPFNFKGGINQTILILVVIAFIVLDSFFWKLRVEWFKYIGLTKQPNQRLMNQDINEELPLYWEALTGHHQKLWYATELYNRHRGII